MKTTLAITLLALTATVLGAQDLSDAPAPYPQFTFFQPQGGTRLDYLGSGCTDDMSHGSGWTVDEYDDGVEFINMTKGGMATIKVAVVCTYTNNDLAIWMDFNNDGDWLDAGERVVWAGASPGAPNGAFNTFSAPPYGGSNTSFNQYSISIPAGAVGTSVKVRAILWDTSAHTSGPMMLNGGGHPGGATGTGFSDFGECEDFDIFYNTNTGARSEIWSSDGMTLNNLVLHGGTYALGNLTAGQQVNVFYAIKNNVNASYFMRFTQSPTMTVTNIVNCTPNQAIVPGNGATVAPGQAFMVITMLTPTTANLPFSYQLNMFTNDPNVPTYTITASGNATPPAPKIEVHRPTYTLIPNGGTDAVGSQSAGNALALNYTIFNTGSADLNLTGTPMVQLSAQNNCNATVTSQPPVSTLQGGGWSMGFSISVTPTTSSQAFSFTITIPNNDTTHSNSPYVITVSGMAGTASGAPEINLKRGTTNLSTGSTDNVGNQTAGVQTSFSYTIENTGTAALSLSGSPAVQLSLLTNCSASVAAQPATSIAQGASANFTVNVTPSAGAFSLRITIGNNDADENPYIINIAGNGQSTSAPEVDLQRGASIADGGSDNVGTLPAGSASAFVYTVANTGNAALSVSNLNVGTLSNCTVNVTTQPGSSVGAGGGTTFTVAVTPVAGGSFSAQLSLPNNDADENPYDFTITGSGQVQAPDIAVQRPIGTTITGTESMGTLAFGTPLTLTYTITNPGTQPLSLTGSPAVQVASISNCTISVQSQPAGTSIPGGSSVTFVLSLNIGSAAGFSFSVSIDNNVAGKNPYAWTASGMGGTLPEIEVQRTSGSVVSTGGGVNVGQQATAFSLSAGFVILNQGNADLLLTATPAVQISGQTNCNVTVTTQPGSTIAPGSGSTFNVDFSIANAGPFSFTVTIQNNDADEGSYSFTVSGDGSGSLFSKGGNGSGGGGGCVAESNGSMAIFFILLAVAFGWRRVNVRRRQTR